MNNTIKIIKRNLHPKQLHKDNWSLINRYKGHCYHAAAALKLLNPELNLHVGKWDCEIHWWNSDKNGNIIDITAEQYDTPYAYQKGRIVNRVIMTLPLRRLLKAIENDNQKWFKYKR